MIDAEFLIVVFSDEICRNCINSHLISKGPIYKISYELSEDDHKFIVRSTYDRFTIVTYNVLRYLLEIL